MKRRKIGILAGTFDPVHKGHIAFAIEAARTCDLDKVYLLPERSPRIKKDVTDFDDRLAMLKLAVKDHEELDVLELHEDQFTVSGTLPRLRTQFAPAQVVFLLGSDVAANLGNWPGLGPLIIGLRRDDERADAERVLSQLDIPEPATLISSPDPHAASSQARQQKTTNYLDSAVLDYIKAHKLYSSK